MLISIPTINDSLHDFKAIYRIYDRCLTTNEAVTIDFSACTFLKQNAVAFLASLVEWLRTRGTDVRLRWDTCQPRVLANLKRNGFTKRFNFEHLPVGANAVQVSQFVDASQEDDVVSYLEQNWIGNGWVDLSPDLAGAIIGNIWEIFANSFEHSQSPTGLFVCGQHYPNRHELALSVVDFGVGIPGKVRRHLNDPRMGAADAFRWALQRGNSTRIGRPGGLGLDMLKEFISVNNGEMAVYSRDGYFRWFGSDEQFGAMPHDFRGTLVNLVLKCDERHYYLG